jgi:hypothetical protein
LDISTAGGSAFTSSATAPSSPVNGDHWFDSSSGVLYVRVDSTWLDISTSGSSSSGGGWSLISTSDITSSISSLIFSGDYSAYDQLKIVMVNMKLTNQTTIVKMSDDSGSTFCTWDQTSAIVNNHSGFKGSNTAWGTVNGIAMSNKFGPQTATNNSQMFEMDIYLNGTDIAYTGVGHGNDEGGDHCFMMSKGTKGNISTINYIKFQTLNWLDGQVRLYGLTT